MTEKLRAEFESWANDSGLFDEPAEYTQLMMYVRDEHNIAFDAWVHASNLAIKNRDQLIYSLKKVLHTSRGLSNISYNLGQRDKQWKDCIYPAIAAHADAASEAYRTITKSETSQ